MKDAYKILEIKPSATDTEIKQAFIKLKNKYDPNNYDKPDLKKIAIEKTKEIEQAFDEIMNSRRLDRLQHNKSTSSYSTKNNNSSYTYNSSTTNNSSEFTDFNYIESLINSNNLEKAQNLLNSINENNRPAEWFYLKGLVQFKKGWLEDAINFLNAALRMDPTNKKYSTTLQQIRWQQRGNFSPFGNNQNNQTPYPQTASCGFCDSCMGFMCANAICSCCEDNALGGC